MSSNAEEIQKKIFEFVLAHMFLFFTVFEHLLLFRYCFVILKKTTTLLNLQNMSRQKLLSSSVDRFTKR